MKTDFWPILLCPRVTPILLLPSFGLTGAVASTEVKQKLQEFLLSKSAKDPVSNGISNSMIHHQKLWYTYVDSVQRRYS